MLNFKVLLYLSTLLAGGLMMFSAALLPSLRPMVQVRTILLVLFTPVIALLGGSGLLFHAYLICVTAFTSRSRLELCATYMLMLPMSPSIAITLDAGGTYLIPLYSFTSLNIGVLLGMLLTRGRISTPFLFTDLSAAAIFFMFLYIDARGISGTAILRTAVQDFLLLVPPYLLVSRTVTDADSTKRVLLFLVLAALLGSFAAIFGALERWDLYEAYYTAMDIERPSGSTSLAIRGGMLRSGGSMNDYSAFGLFLAAVLCLLPALRGAFSRVGFLGVSAVLLAALFTTQSRGAWVGLMAGYGVSLALRGRALRGAALLGAAVAGYAALVFLLTPSSGLSETLGTSGGSAETGEYRRMLLERGLEQVASHPLAGQPPKQLIANLPSLIQGQHIVDFVNTHLYVAMTAGVPLFLLWMAIWIGAAVRLSRRSRLGGRGVEQSALATAPAAVVVASMVALTFTSIADRNLYWLLISLGLAAPTVAASSRARFADFFEGRRSPAATPT